jgi:hypothetical protein
MERKNIGNGSNIFSKEFLSSSMKVISHLFSGISISIISVLLDGSPFD